MIPRCASSNERSVAWVRLPTRSQASGDRNCPSVSSCRSIGQFAMRRTIGFSANCRLPAEVKTVFVARTHRPAAHSRSQSLQSDHALVVRLIRRRPPTLGQLETEGLADDSILCNAQSATDFTGGNFFVPQCDQGRSPLRGPFWFHEPLLPSIFGKKEGCPPSRSEQRTHTRQYVIPLCSHSTEGSVLSSGTIESKGAM